MKISPVLLVVIWILGLGAVGFAAGYFGPIVFNPKSNSGPLVGIFMSGPVGLALGLGLGLVAVWRAWSLRIQAGLFLVVALVLGGGTLLFIMPR